MHTYDYQAIERRWQRYWEENKTFRTASTVDRSRPKYYVLDMFPYPSGVGLHVGHPLGYIATDIVGRYKRMQGYNVLHPMGFDAFGLPAEQYAVEYGIHPRVTTEKNISNMVRQLKRLGLGYDWDRSFATTDEKYYRWTQWIFLQLYESYYDESEDRARPISSLVRRLELDQVFITPEGQLTKKPQADSIKWSAESSSNKEAALSTLRLAYLDEVPVNWCPGLGTVLANEEVTAEGKSERGGFPVFRRPLKQWMLRITAFADRLEEDLGKVDWPEPVKMMQRNWIGKSIGATVLFESVAGPIEVFTTRPDTLFGATYMVLAPEHPFVAALTSQDRLDSVQSYVEASAQRSDMDRIADVKTKTGVFTGGFAINPVSGREIPVWVSDYVLMGYGTGAIMAVPAHDQRDCEFARQFDLEIQPVVKPSDEWLRDEGKSLDDYLADPNSCSAAFSGYGVAVNSQNDSVSLNGLSTEKAKARITAWLAEGNLGASKVQYKLRDWLFSRQRYWGEPFPILHGPNGELRVVDADKLPVVLPKMDDFKPNASEDPDAPPAPPLGRADDSWKFVTIDGIEYTRELNTMPNWAGSCWYYLRFIDPDNDDLLVDPELEAYWMSDNGVDLYVGGVEHAVLHLLYARFWHKLLFDLGFVSGPEPFGKLFNQGYIQAYAYTDDRGVYVPADEVIDQESSPAHDVQDQPGREYFHKGQPVEQSYGKMGKSLKNAISPDEICERYGCDTLRLYEMYLGPLESSKPWNTRDIVGVHRFLNRVWRNYVDEDSGNLKISDAPPGDAQLRALHKTIDRVSSDLDRLSFNTSIAALIEFNSTLVVEQSVPREIAETFVKLLAPTAPHIAEELWSRLGNSSSVAEATWPKADPELLQDETSTIAVQVNGKVRGKIEIGLDASKESVLQTAKANANVAKFLEGKESVREIYVPGKIVNLVVK